MKTFIRREKRETRFGVLTRRRIVRRPDKRLHTIYERDEVAAEKAYDEYVTARDSFNDVLDDDNDILNFDVAQFVLYSIFTNNWAFLLSIGLYLILASGLFLMEVPRLCLDNPLWTFVASAAVILAYCFYRLYRFATQFGAVAEVAATDLNDSL